MNCIVVVDQNWAIGCEGGLLFSLPTDMKRFRSLTIDGTVILGRKTLDSFPGGRPLPRRRNIVITRKVDFDREGCEIVPSPQAALEAAAGTEEEQLWVIGGGSVYTALLPKCKRAFVTRVDSAAPEADTFFPNLDKLPGWEVESVSEPVEENGVTYRFVDYINTKI
ncbi:dihydrofolate reductase [Dysosmobacter sp. Sow4_B12]|uniref:dihydrofolate reductase n=1 Tax=Dysosmobacter sp. Sow4_B12 TaxID=3438777 RepID=UPI003F92B113